MNTIEKELQQRNPRLSPRADFVGEVMAKLPDAPDRASWYRQLFRVLAFPFGTVLAGVATFALLAALFVLPSVREGNKPKDPDVARGEDTRVVSDVQPVENSTLPPAQEVLEELPIEQEIASVESEINELEKDIESFENDLSNESLGLN